MTLDPGHRGAESHRYGDRDDDKPDKAVNMTLGEPQESHGKSNFRSRNSRDGNGWAAIEDERELGVIVNLHVPAVTAELKFMN